LFAERSACSTLHRESQGRSKNFGTEKNGNLIWKNCWAATTLCLFYKRSNMNWWSILIICDNILGFSRSTSPQCDILLIHPLRVSRVILMAPKNMCGLTSFLRAPLAQRKKYSHWKGKHLILLCLKEDFDNNQLTECQGFMGLYMVQLYICNGVCAVVFGPLST